MRPDNVTRMLRWFEKNPSDIFVGEAELEGISLSELQMAFEVADNNPMYDCWPVQSKHIDLIQRFSDVKIDLRKFDYFVEADA